MANARAREVFDAAEDALGMKLTKLMLDGPEVCLRVVMWVWVVGQITHAV